ncbi:MAG: exonuclease domain-containing protein [Dongiaceae bacterium]
MWSWLKRLFGQPPPKVPRGAAAPEPSWLKVIPPRVVAVDVETTGLTASDRIVSLAAIRLDTHDLPAGGLDLKYLHLVVNPGRPSHPQAARVHGYSDLLLRQQEPFSAHAEQARQFIQGGGVIVAHNAAFDLEFINREFAIAGQAPLSLPVYCTMESFRRARAQGRASLDALCEEMDLSRSGSQHDAIEDAWLALMGYLWLHGCPYRSSLPDGFVRAQLATDKATSTKALSTAPSAPLTDKARRLHDVVAAVKQAKREGRMVDAVVMLKREVDRQEATSRETGLGVAPWYYEQLAVLYRKHGLDEEELDILERYERQTKAPGRSPFRLAERLEKIRSA